MLNNNGVDYDAFNAISFWNLSSSIFESKSKILISKRNEFYKKLGNNEKVGKTEVIS